MRTIGLISDVHGLVRVRVVRGDTDPAGAVGVEPRIDERFDQVRVVVTHGHELVRPGRPH